MFFFELVSCGFAFVGILGQLLQLFKIGERIATQKLKDRLVAAVLLTNVVVLRTEFFSESFRIERRGSSSCLISSHRAPLLVRFSIRVQSIGQRNTSR